MKKHLLLVRDGDGYLRVITPYDTMWYLKYVKEDTRIESLLKKFHHMFRLHHATFIEIVNDMSEHPIFEAWTKCNTYRSPPYELYLLLIGVLRYFGKGCTFDNIEECTAISRETNQRCFHKHLDYGSDIIQYKHVTSLFINMMASIQFFCTRWIQ